MTAKKILEMPIIYDIIISDFGRDATLEYLRLVSISEKRTIESILEKEGYKFFDEYRRIMFTVIADLAFLKKTAIEEGKSKDGFISDNILIGLGSTTMSQEFVDHVTLSAIQEIFMAIHRGHKRFRIMIPCNTLSGLAKEIGQKLKSIHELERIVKTYSPTLVDYEKIVLADISVHTVPQSVIHHLPQKYIGNNAIQLLVLGTRGTNSIYRGLSDGESITILPITESEQEIIEKAIVASIGNHQADIELYQQQIRKKIIEPNLKQQENLVVLEACTDFHLGLGISSLEVFANAMVMDCYKSVLV